MTISEARIRIDVGLVMRDEVIRSTPFSSSDYDPGIVPSKEWDAGFRADVGGWALILKQVELRLHQLNSDYRVLHIPPDLPEETLDVSLRETTSKLTSLIVNGISGL